MIQNYVKLSKSNNKINQNTSTLCGDRGLEGLSKPDHPLGDPRGFPRSHCPGSLCFAQLSLPGGWGFKLGKFSTVLKENWQELFHLLQRNHRQLEKQVFLCCFISTFAKIVNVYCIFNDIDHFQPIRSF